MSKTWTVTVEQNPEDEDNLVLPLPPDVLESIGWQIGDTLDWADNGNGTWSLKKVLDNSGQKAYNIDNDNSN